MVRAQGQELPPRAVWYVRHAEPTRAPSLRKPSPCMSYFILVDPYQAKSDAMHILFFVLNLGPDIPQPLNELSLVMNRRELEVNVLALLCI